MKICPKCGKENFCTVANQQDPKNCWCMKIFVSKPIKTEIENKYSNQDCLCKSCLEEEISDYKKKMFL